jgi:hypothetical protein
MLQCGNKAPALAFLDMTTSSPASRDTRIDVFRALALITIYVNHIPGTFYEHFTHRNIGFSDAAEAFVLISGIAVGLAYGMKFRPENRLLMTLKAMRRAATLYLTHIVTTLVSLAIFSAGAVWFAEPELLTKINIEKVMTATPEAMIGFVTLGHQLGYNNLLPLYAVLLLAVPLFLLIGAVSMRALLAVSGLLWLVSGIFRIAPPNYPNDGVWFLNPLSWQFLFVIGMVGLIHARRGGRLPTHPLLLGAAGLYLVVSLLWVRLPLWHVDISAGLPEVLTGFNKTYLSAPRLLHVLSAAYLIAAVPAISSLARTDARHPLAILGKHSLPVFVTGTLLSMIGQVVKEIHPDGFALDTALISGGLLIQFAIAYYLEWLRSIGWGGKKVQPAPARPAPAPRAAELPMLAVRQRSDLG